VGWNRTAKQFSETLRPGVLTLEGTFAIGSTGAITKSSGDGFTIARTGTGAYTITLDEKFVSLMGVQYLLIDATLGQYSQFATLTDAVASTKTITFVAHQAGVATDPSSGAVLKIIIVGRKTDAK